MLRSEIEERINQELQALKKLQKLGKSVDMTRGRPSKDQLAIAMPMLSNAENCNFNEEGIDARNYGELAGFAPARELLAKVFGVDNEEVIVSDGSSLRLMHDLVQFAMQFGILGATPWNKLDKVKFICPAPGYDRHFFICEHFGIEMITVPMLDDGPDMNIVERLVDDESVKGMWCVPKYSNPTGVVYSDSVVTRIANLKPKSKDFRVFWDNAYIFHSLYDEDIKLLNIFDIAKKCGNEDMIYEFTSTSKITFAGSGISSIATSKANVNGLLDLMKFKLINPNKVNQALHVDFLKSVDNIKDIMREHSSILRPKFELFDDKMRIAFEGDDTVKWTKPRGGYFVSLDVKGLAKRVVEIAGENGVKFTAAGSTYPYGNDHLNQNIRIAPSVPTLSELDFAIDVLIHAIRLAKLEAQLKEN